MNGEAHLNTGIGAPAPRVEDRRLLTGAGRYSDDENQDNQLHAVMVRADHAHAELHNVGLKEAQSTPGVRAVAEISTPLPTYPNWRHMTEIDPDTGVVEILRHTGIDDVERVINPPIVDGQTHGGIVQGVRHIEMPATPERIWRAINSN